MGVGDRNGWGLWKESSQGEWGLAWSMMIMFLRAERMLSSPWLLFCRICSFSEPTPLTCSQLTYIQEKKTHKKSLSFLLFPAEEPPPSSAWRPVALILIILCLVLLIGLAILGFVCKSALWLGGGGSWLQGLSRMRNICYEFLNFIFNFTFHV